MGESVVFETVRQLGRDRLTAHCRLVVSGRTASSAPREFPAFDSDREILDHLVGLGGTDPANPQPGAHGPVPARRTYRAITRYRPVPDAVVDTPVLCPTGDGDPQVAPEEAAAWKSHTTAGFRLKMLPGEHCFLTDHPDTVVRLVAECADAGVGGR
ncbi:thioesterase II family protein [Streptomyces mirabilis]|uniref:thioesterase II family protein n=1 Tax=Streptomyces mirabilis TaxID=68239 RepID=UPI0036882EC3